MFIVPTARCYGLLVAIGAIAVVLATVFPEAIALDQALTGMLGLDGILLCAALWDGWQARQQRVAVARATVERLSIGRDNTVTVTLTPPVPAADWEIQLADAYPTAMAGPAMPLRATLNGGNPQQLTYAVRPDARGEVAWGDLYVRQRGPFGLAWHGWRVPQAQTAVVYPDLVALRSLSVRLALQSTGTLRRVRQLNAGTEFSELRDYARGDDPRLIDWKATARRGQPLIRVMEPEQEQTLIILLDRGRLMTARVDGVARFDWGLNALLALALAGIERGDRVGVGVFDRDMHLWMPPQRGRTHFNHLVERLAPIEPVLLESDYPSAVSAVVAQQHRRALVVILTDVVDATASMELLSALARLRPRYLPLCVPLRDPYIDTRAHTPATDVTGAYERAVALDLLAQRQVALAQLRQKGVLVLDAPANGISEPLVEQYLRIKARNQL